MLDGSLSMDPSLSSLTQRNVDTIAEIEAASQKKRTRAERISDAIAVSIGSWPFLLSQAAILCLWMVLNLAAWTHHWDPYPFILLNLALSFQAAFAGPIIMMSQNRQSRFYEQRNQLDLQINLLAEQENTEMLRLLRLLCEKAGISSDQLSSCKVLAEETAPASLIQQIASTTANPVPITPPRPDA